MAKVTLSQDRVRQFGGAAGAYGNVTTLRFPLATNAAGGAANADSAAALAIGDVVVLGTLPGGMRLDDASVFVTTGMTATLTGSLGFAYADGVDDASASQDAAYFGAGLDLATAGRVRAKGAKLLVLAKPANLILTTAVVKNAKASQIDVIVTGELTGPK